MPKRMILQTDPSVVHCTDAGLEVQNIVTKLPAQDKGTGKTPHPLAEKKK